MTWRTAFALFLLFSMGIPPSVAQSTDQQAPVAAKTKGMGSVAGTIRDSHGDSWPDVALNFYVSNGDRGNLTAVEEDATEFDMQRSFSNRGLGEGGITTREDGSYHFGLPAGLHMMTIKEDYRLSAIIPFPIFAGVVTPGNVNFKTALLNRRILETHFAAGQSDLDQVKSLRDQIVKASDSAQATLQAKLNIEVMQAIKEFQQALAATDEDDSFFRRWTVLTKIAEADDAAGKYADAAKVYEQAVVLKPDMTLYNNLGTDLARGGQVDAAISAYKRGVELQSSDSADAYLNFGITFYNANRLTEAVAPLRKATELDPRNAEAWYLLGVTLLGAAHQQGDAGMVLKLLPGTIEAFQKAVQLDPQSHYGQQAREALSELQRVSQNSSIKGKPQ